jgi:hypothetical protein
MTSVKMYAQDYDEMSPYYVWTTNGPGGVTSPWQEAVNPYIKNQQIWVCPSAPKDSVSYTAGCLGGGAAHPPKVISSYCWAGWLPYNWWGWFDGKAKMAGFPTLNTGLGYGAPVQYLSTEFTAYPSEAAFLQEGYYVVYDSYPGVTFGSACTTGFDPDETHNKINRHQMGENIGYSDGHAKFVRTKTFHWDASAGPYNFQGNIIPVDAFMQTGAR